MTDDAALVERILVAHRDLVEWAKYLLNSRDVRNVLLAIEHAGLSVVDQQLCSCPPGPCLLGASKATDCRASTAPYGNPDPTTPSETRERPA